MAARRDAGSHAPLAPLARALLQLEARTIGLEKTMRPAVERVPHDWREGARNLVH